jgi:hypothetical protein
MYKRLFLDANILVDTSDKRRKNHQESQKIYSTPNSQDNKTEILIPPLTCYVKPQLSNGLHTLHH